MLFGSPVWVASTKLGACSKRLPDLEVVRVNPLHALLHTKSFFCDLETPEVRMQQVRCSFWGGALMLDSIDGIRHSNGTDDKISR